MMASAGNERGRSPSAVSCLAAWSSKACFGSTRYIAMTPVENSGRHCPAKRFRTDETKHLNCHGRPVVERLDSPRHAVEGEMLGDVGATLLRLCAGGLRIVQGPLHGIAQ